MDTNNAKKYLTAAVKRVKENDKVFFDCFPTDQTVDYVYSSTEEKRWVEGFWTGINMLAYEFSGDDEIYSAVEAQVKRFEERNDADDGLDHHDMGFLYTLSCVAKYKCDNDMKAREAAIGAADKLCRRFREKGNFIQAWGALDKPDEYRLITDCLMNIPILFWAYEETGNERYKYIAESHLETSLNTVIRDDYTTHHTYYFDIDTGAPVGGKTAQGYSDDSCWARGQAWAVYGLALAYRYTKSEKVAEYFRKVTDTFISKLPSDYIPYWDMVFGDGSGEPRDSSAASIAACGIMEMNKYIQNEKYMDIAMKMIDSLSENYNISENPDYNAIISDGLYDHRNSKKPEANIWGDYFYMEALMRIINPEWRIYW